MVNKLFIGVDVGSTAIKLGMIDINGSLISYHSTQYKTNRISETIIEQDPNDWFSLITNSLSKFRKENPNIELFSLCLCSQVNTHIFIDKNGDSLLPAIFWQDGRARNEALEINNLLSDEKKISWWGSPMPIDASHVIARMLWVKRHKPSLWDKTKYVLLPKDFCIMKLTGEVSTDPLSNIGLVNNKLEYIPEVLNLVSGASEKVAPLKNIKEVVGLIKDGISFQGTKVINGTMDAWMGLLGTGGHKQKTSIYLSGTSEILGINSDEVIPTQGVVVFPEYDKIRLHAGPTQSGGASKLWFCNLFNITPELMIKAVEKNNFDEISPIFLPHLQGERAPIWQSNLKGMFYGMTSKTDVSQLARAVYEGVAFSSRLLLESLETSANHVSSEINCGGGGFQSDIWNQIRANILNKKINRLSIKDPGILGAAGIAGFGVGVYSSIDEAFKKITKFDRSYRPEKNFVQRYSEIYEIYRELTNYNISISEKFSSLNK
jgi:xylulokinase|tara:strand:+ start:1059 stop:2528 length:1470 start_codon:yes stop_codon:yes gene_type:complete